MMKSTYRRPAVTEFGRIDQLTLGATGTLPDFQYDNGPPGNLKYVNNNCNASPPASGCLLSS